MSEWDKRPGKLETLTVLGNVTQESMIDAIENEAVAAWQGGISA